MPGLFAGLTQGDWSDDPDRNEQAQMGALLGASRAIDTYGKTGGRLLSDALGGFVEGQMGMRGQQLKEKSVNSDIAYKSALTKQMGGQSRYQIMQIGMEIHKNKMAAWQQQSRAIMNRDGARAVLPPRPQESDSLFEANEVWSRMGQGGAGPQNGAGGIFAPSGGSAPQQQPASGLMAASSPPGPLVPPTPQGPAPETPPPTPTQPVAGLSKSIDPSDPQGWAGINAQIRANAPAAKADRLTLLNQERAGADPKVQALLDTEIKGLGGTPGGQPMLLAGGSGQGMGNAAPQQARDPIAERLATLQRGAEGAYYHGMPWDKDEVATAEFARGGKLGENLTIDERTGQVVRMPGALEAASALARANAYASKAPELVSTTNPDGSKTSVTHEQYINDQAAGREWQTEQSPTRRVEQERGPLLYVKPGAGGGADEIVTEDMMRQRLAGGGSGGGMAPPSYIGANGQLRLPNSQGAAPVGQPGLGGIPAGPTSQERLNTRRQEMRQDVEKAGDIAAETAFQKEFDTATTKSEAAAESNNAIAAQRQHIGITGAYTPIGTFAGSYLVGLGIAPEKVKKFVAGGQTLDSLFQDSTIKKSIILEGNLSNADADRVERSSARLGNTPEANRYLLDVLQAVNDRQIMRASNLAKAQKYARENGTSLNEARVEVGRSLQARSFFDMPSMQKYKDMRY